MKSEIWCSLKIGNVRFMRRIKLLAMKLCVSIFSMSVMILCALQILIARGLRQKPFIASYLK